jgi:hypothetical protein
MTRDKSRWDAEFRGCHWTRDELILVTRLDRERDRFVDVVLSAEDAESVHSTIERFMLDRAKSATDKSTIKNVQEDRIP